MRRTRRYTYNYAFSLSLQYMLSYLEVVVTAYERCTMAMPVDHLELHLCLACLLRDPRRLAALWCHPILGLCLCLWDWLKWPCGHSATASAHAVVQEQTATDRVACSPTKACGIMMPSHLKALFVLVRLMKGSTLFSRPVDSEWHLVCSQCVHDTLYIQ